jgi:hypothetical protein
MAKKDFEHLALDQIASTPEILRLLMATLTEEQTLRKPAPDRWSVAENLEHLSHVEGHYFKAALDVLLCGDDALIEPYDQNAYAAEGTYSGREPEESFAHWEEQRESNVELIRTTLEPEALSRTARHPELGTFTVEHLLNEWALHDLSHVRQIAELVRGLVFYPAIGPFQAHYTVKP